MPKPGLDYGGAAWQTYIAAVGAATGQGAVNDARAAMRSHASITGGSIDDVTKKWLEANSIVPDKDGSFTFPTVAAFPVIESIAISTTDTWDTSTPFVITPPAGIEDGDKLVCVIFKNDDVGVPAMSGFAADLSVADTAGDDRRTSLLSKTASSESGNYSGTMVDATARMAVAIMLRVSNCHADIFDVNPAGGHLTDVQNDKNTASPAMTSATDNALMVVCQHLVSGMTAFGVPSGFTLIGSDFTELQAHVGQAYFDIESAGLKTPGVYTSTVTGTPDGHRLSFMLKAA